MTATSSSGVIASRPVTPAVMDVETPVRTTGEFGKGDDGRSAVAVATPVSDDGHEINEKVLTQ
jgi:hypothetical protein